MLKHRTKYDDEFKKNAVKLSYTSPKPVHTKAEDLGIAENLLYNRRKKYTAAGEKTPMVMMEEEIKVLQLENAELKMEQSTRFHGYARAAFDSSQETPAILYR